jgi:hypothetical protein
MQFVMHVNGARATSYRTLSQLAFHPSLFDLIFSDVWGPAPTSVGKNNYYVSFIDDYSKFTWIYLLRHKSKVFSCFKDFQNLIERQFDSKILRVQSDWGVNIKP